MLHVVLPLVLLLCGVSRGELLLTYSPPSDFQPTGFGVFSLGIRDFTAVQTVGGRLLSPGRVAGVLPGSVQTVVFGAFNWFNGAEAYNLLLVNSLTGAVSPLAGPSVWGAGAEAACWRDESRASFFVVGQLMGLQSSPQSLSSSMGISLCSPAGCGSLSNGLRELPQAMQYVSMAYDSRGRTLFVVYRALPAHGGALGSAPVSLLAAYSEQAGWTYRSVFSTSTLGQVFVPRIFVVQSTVWVNVDASPGNSILGSLFCPTSRGPVPSLISIPSSTSSQCWTPAPRSMFGPNNTITDLTIGTSTQQLMFSLTRLSSNGKYYCGVTQGNWFGEPTDCTFNLNELVGDRPATLVGSDSSMFAVALHSSMEQKSVPVFQVDLEQQVWRLVYEVKEPECLKNPSRAWSSAVASQSPVTVSRDGNTLLYTCPFASNAVRLPTGVFSLYSYHIPNMVLATVIPPSMLESAAHINDMCVAGDTVFLRGAFNKVDVARGRDLPSPHGIVTWQPGTGTWNAVAGFGDGASLAPCTTDSSFLWIPFVVTPNASVALAPTTMSLAHYSCLSGEWLFSTPSVTLPSNVAGLMLTGHSRSGLSRDKGALYQTWSVLGVDGSVFGLLVRLLIPTDVSGPSSLDQVSWEVIGQLSSCDDCDQSPTFSNTVEFGGYIWVVGSFELLWNADPQQQLFGVLRVDIATHQAMPIKVSQDEYLFAADADVGTFTGPAGYGLWLGGSIKNVPTLGNVMNVVALDKDGNFSQSTAQLLSPPSRLKVASLFFASDAMVTVSRDTRSGYGEFSSGMNLFSNGNTFPDPNVQAFFFNVYITASIEVNVLAAPWTVAVVILATVVLMAAVSLLIPCLWKRYENSEAFRYIVLPDYASNGFNTNIGVLLSDENIMKLDSDEVVLGATIGQGGQGVVRKAKYRGKDIACKALFEFDAKLFSNFIREIKLTSLISHANVLNFIGVLMQDDVLWACSELMDTDLTRVLGQLSSEARMQVARDITEGMAYLHSFHPPILHRDLKPSNILVSRSGAVKIADFGVSRLGQNTTKNKTREAGTFLYMAPECFGQMGVETHNGSKADVFSFGLVLLEIFTNHPPYDPTLYSHMMEFVEKVRLGLLRPNLAGLSPSVPQNVRDVIEQSLSRNPDLRPSFAEIKTMLK